MIRVVLILILGLSTVIMPKALFLLEEERASHDQKDESRTPLYLPAAPFVKLLSFGFNNFLGDILWFNTLSYFGKHYGSDKDYRWLTHMCNLVTDLDKNAEHVYEFCGNLLSWEAKDIDGAITILSKGIATHPQYWRFFYLRGFTFWYFLNDMDKARIDFERSSKLPDAPIFLASIASRLLVNTATPESAIEFLENILKTAQDQTSKKALEERLNQAKLARDLSALDKAKNIYQNQTGKSLQSIQELIRAGVITRLPLDPFGGKYSYDPQTKTFVTSSGQKPLRFHVSKQAEAQHQLLLNQQQLGTNPNE
ncbi:hypothetical protein JNK13_04280 [bacterium]|nr:hypothetical protein [bacterium]